MENPAITTPRFRRSQITRVNHDPAWDNEHRKSHIEYQIKLGNGSEHIYTIKFDHTMHWASFFKEQRGPATFTRPLIQAIDFADYQTSITGIFKWISRVYRELLIGATVLNQSEQSAHPCYPGLQALRASWERFSDLPHAPRFC